MIRYYRFPMSTNCDRLSLALAHKGIEVESVFVPFEDRTEVRKVSGQKLVPVLDVHGEVLWDSMKIVRRLEDLCPTKPLYPSDPARRAEMELFIDWFNRIWKVPPNAIEAELGKPSPDRARIDAWSAEMKGYLPCFEALLQGRTHLFGDSFSAADVCAWPFLRYGLYEDEGDPYLFHRILAEHMPIRGKYPKLAAWIDRGRSWPKV